MESRGKEERKLSKEEKKLEKKILKDEKKHQKEEAKREKKEQKEILQKKGQLNTKFHPSHSFSSLPEAFRDTSGAGAIPVDTVYFTAKTFEELAKHIMLGDPSGVRTATFLLGYRYYKGPSDVYHQWLELLKESAEDSKRKQLRSFMNTWLDSYFRADFFEHSLCNQFMEDISSLSDELKGNLAEIVAKKTQECHIAETIESKIEGKVQIVPKIPKGMTATILGLEEEEVAKVLTVQEFDLFKKVTPSEFMDQNWEKTDKDKLAPNIVKLIRRFNEVGYWVATEIMITKDPKQQITVLEKFIRVARKCQKLNNFSTMTQILSGLNHHTVRRQKKTWEGISNKSKNKYKKVENLMNPANNFSSYRSEIKKKPLPILPNFAIILKDLAFINIGNKPYLESGDINIEMLQMLAATLSLVRTFQEKSFDFPDLPNIPALQHLVYYDDDTLHGMLED